ncbi:MAG: TerD family protein, partial [Clostridiaceae bacterium]|nr:TerD family protein [Clostridiaceae bacterium]
QQNFGQVSNAFVRVVNEDTNEEVLRYDLSEDFSVETALVFCEIYRNKDEWKFSATGSGFQGGLSALCKNYGLDA